MHINTVKLSKNAEKNLKKVPKHIIDKLIGWIYAVAEHGLREVRTVPGYHDEPLLGCRKGQRSIRLSQAYRAIYEIDKSGAIHFIEIIEVTKHEY